MEVSREDYINVDVSGGTREDGFAILTGSRQVRTWNLTSMDVRELAVRADDMAGLVGTMQYTWRNPDSTHHFTATILSASLQSSTGFPGGPVEGHWSGLSIIRKCYGWCNYEYAVNGTRDIEIVLKQSGNALNGSGYFGSRSCTRWECWLPLTGSVDGHAITALNGRLTTSLEAGRGGDRKMILSDFSGTVDDLGRMFATFVYFTDGQQWAVNGPPTLLKVSSGLEMETVWLTREP